MIVLYFSSVKGRGTWQWQIWVLAMESTVLATFAKIYFILLIIFVIIYVDDVH